MNAKISVGYVAERPVYQCLHITRSRGDNWCQTDVSRKTRVELPFCRRMWIYLVVSTWEIFTCVLGTITSVAVGSCNSSGADTVGAAKKTVSIKTEPKTITITNYIV
ncbi:hypothetical protein KP79_PYT17637 [Mizuhopecten yessoensis]|uniref:Uncharacterized protein n=1 Tax=Mizuhopecten yessoensis TaxID=6573 RepID=A0A210Q2D5_MIZYE|nr:hypothetical protein KP79_PYT17637 [Mizuhopecten yessoensis]